jgi:thiaminase
MRAEELIDGYRGLWRAATESALLAALRDGSLEPVRFDAWLAQDYLFVSALLSFLAMRLARAPPSWPWPLER